jgi:ABC-type glutathione transport system ATPase component
LKDKCRVLATHQLWVLNRCDRIIWLEDGRVQAVDTFANLMANDAGFQHLMETTAVEEREEKKEDEEEAGEEVKDKKSKKKKAAGLMQAEERQVKSVPWSVYGSYIKASGSMWSLVLVLLLLVLSNGGKLLSHLDVSTPANPRTSQHRDLSLALLVDERQIRLLVRYIHRRVCRTRRLAGAPNVRLLCISHRVWYHI